MHHLSHILADEFVFRSCFFFFFFLFKHDDQGTETRPMISATKNQDNSIPTEVLVCDTYGEKEEICLSSIYHYYFN